MQKHHPIYDPQIRDAVGVEELYPETAQYAGVTLASYSVLQFKGCLLPSNYRALIFSKWLRSFRHGNDFIRLIDSGAYYHAYHNHIAAVLRNMDTEVRIAALTDDTDVVLGFSVSRGSILDYIHVHKDQRRLGIGTKLMPQGVDTITHVTKTALTIWGSKYKEWKFNPFA